MNKHEAAFEFQKGTLPLVAEGFMTDAGGRAAVELFADILDKYTESLVETLQEQIRKWEVRLLDDETLYSLGLRHSVDLINGEDPDRFFTNGTGVTDADLPKEGYL